jgi:hypothetical protein
MTTQAQSQPEVWTDDPPPTPDQAPDIATTQLKTTTDPSTGLPNFVPTKQAQNQKEPEVWTDDPSPPSYESNTTLPEITVTAHRLNRPYQDEDLSGKAVAGGALNNAIPDAIQNLKGIGLGLWNATPLAYLTGAPMLQHINVAGHDTIEPAPPPTVNNLMSLGFGLMQQGANKVGQTVGVKVPQLADTATAQGVENTYADRYLPQNGEAWNAPLLNTIKNHPVSFGLDVASAIDPAIRGVAGAADASKVGALSDAASAAKSGVAASDASTNPAINRLNNLQKTAAPQAASATPLPTDPAMIKPEDITQQTVAKHLATGNRDLTDIPSMQKIQAADNAAKNAANGFQPTPQPQPVNPPAKPLNPLAQQYNMGKAGQAYDPSIVEKPHPIFSKAIDTGAGLVADYLTSKLGGNPLVSGAAAIGSGYITDLLQNPAIQSRIAYQAGALGKGLNLNGAGSALSGLGDVAKNGINLGSLTATSGHNADTISYGQRNLPTWDTEISLKDYKKLNPNSFVSDDQAEGAASR